MKPSMVVFALFSCLLIGCASGPGSVHYVKLTVEEDSLLQHNWEIAHQLADYDRYSWIATDSLLQYIGKPDPEQMQGWVVTGSGTNRKVTFGKVQGTVLKSLFEVSFQGEEITSYPHPEVTYSNRDEAYLGIVAIDTALQANKAALDSANFPYNTYVFVGKDTVEVYLMPGATNEYYGFCGGLHTFLSARTLSVLETKKLHQSALVVKPPKGAAALVRTSSLSIVPNEVDLAQTLIFRNLPSDHYIMTSKYMFAFSWDRKRKNVSMRVMDNTTASSE